MKYRTLLLSLFLTWSLSGKASDTIHIFYDTTSAQVEFAAEELQSVLQEKMYVSFKFPLEQINNDYPRIVLARKDNMAVLEMMKGEGGDTISPGEQSFALRTISRNDTLSWWVIGGDERGIMYGGLRLAETLKYSNTLPGFNQDVEPYVLIRGIKYNIPIDARTPSYDDSGDAARLAVPHMWDWDFWTQYLDELARSNFNLLTLWSDHIFPSMVKLEGYPDVALDDVYMKKEGVYNQWEVREDNIELVKTISIDDKIKFWQDVMQYAADRGIDIYVFHWNVFVYGAEGKYGIQEEQDNDVTIAYLRESVKQLLLTYPLIKGIGVTAGENIEKDLTGEYAINNWLYRTYGKGVEDVKELQPERDIVFIYRQLWSSIDEMESAFKDYPYPIHTSFKYTRAHIHSIENPPHFDHAYRNEVEQHGWKCWMNLRTDDMYVYRWGDPEFANRFLRNLPLDIMPGFYLGADGFVDAREFISKEPVEPGQLEIDKHWYRLKIWGQQAYDINLTPDYFKHALRYRFPGTNENLLYDTWQAASQVVPLINRFMYWGNDFEFAPEACISRDYFFDVVKFMVQNPIGNSGIINVTEYVNNVLNNRLQTGITPLQVADDFEVYTAQTLAGLTTLRGMDESREYAQTLNDLEAFAHLGNYYANKIRSAVELRFYRSTEDKVRQDSSLALMYRAIDSWKEYARVSTSQYKPQKLCRVGDMDWYGILEKVERDTILIKLDAGDLDGQVQVNFSTPKDGDVFPEGQDLNVIVTATSDFGIDEVHLFVNDEFVRKERYGEYKWEPSKDPLLNNMPEGTYQLRAIATDHIGFKGEAAISITVEKAAGIPEGNAPAPEIRVDPLSGTIDIKLNEDVPWMHADAYDLLGRQICSAQSTSGSIRIIDTRFENGIYLVVLRFGDSVVARKIRF